MKIKKLVMVLGGIVIFIGVVYFLNLFHKEPDLMPTCFVQNHNYYVRHNDTDERFYEEVIDNQYEYYGIVETLVDEYPEDDLSTDNGNWHKKEVYVDKNDDTYIYIKMGDQQYLKLYYEDHESM